MRSIYNLSQTDYILDPPALFAYTFSMSPGRCATLQSERIDSAAPGILSALNFKEAE